MATGAFESAATEFSRKYFGLAASVAPGLLLACVIAAASQYLSEHVGGPAMLFALLIGMAFNYLATAEQLSNGIQFSTRFILRLGVALLGARITLAQISGLGVETLVLVVAGVALTIFLGAIIGRLLGLTLPHAILSAGAVAICGASAALAIASVLPRVKDLERQTILTVASVTTLSTLCMVIYPAIASALGLDDRWAGVFIGATIHDVAQVIGAGYTISDVAGETAAIVKLLRVACLLPVIVILSLAFRSSHSDEAKRPPLVPWFLIAFVGLVVGNSFNLFNSNIHAWFNVTSQWALLTAVAALGVKTSLGEFAAVGPRPLLALVAQTALLAIFVLSALSILTN